MIAPFLYVCFYEIVYLKWYFQKNVIKTIGKRLQY